LPELSSASLLVSSTCELLHHFKSKHAVLKPELQLKCEMSHKEISLMLVSVEASGGVGFVAVEVKVRRIVAFCIGGRGYIKKYQS
jgi:hypothetical protein